MRGTKYQAHVTVYAAEAAHYTVDVSDPNDAARVARCLIRRHGARSGHFDIPAYPNQNTRNRFLHGYDAGRSGLHRDGEARACAWCHAQAEDAELVGRI